MPINTESLNRELFRLLSKYKPKPLDAEGKVTPIPDEADIFKFEFTKDGKDYGTVYVTLDEDRVLTVYFGDDVANSPDDKTPKLDYDDTWSGLLHQLSAWRMTKGLKGFNTQNKDRVADDMARRNHMRNKDKIAEGYYATGKKSSYSDAVPSVKIVIEHSRVIEEGEQRYRNINRIFLENQAGERYLLDTKKPGIARVYARHIAEGGKVNDDRWSHIGSLCEEYQKMAGFVRATRNGQFNESAQSLVNEGIAHYQSLRESLSRMTGKRGYNSYFESWTPALMEDGTEENNLNELFVQETLDPRIESVMPILNRIHKKVSESAVDKEMHKLAEWADSLVEEGGESLTSNNPIGIPEDVPGIDREKYTERPGLEGPFSTKSGKVVYYDKQEGKYYDPGTDFYISHDDYQAMNEQGVAEGSDGYEPIAHAIEQYITKHYDGKSGLDTDDFMKVARMVRNGDINDARKFASTLDTDPRDRLLSMLGQGVAEDLDADQKRVGQLGPTEKVKNNNIGKLVGANENFINTVDQAVVSEEDEMAESILSAIKKVGKKVLDKVAPGDEELLKQLDKDVHGGKVPNRYNSDAESAKKYPADSLKAKVDEAAAPWETEEEADKREKEEGDKEPKATKGKDGSEHGGHARAKHLAKSAIPKDKEEVSEGQDELARILQIMNHRR